jgi:putative membrane protein
MRFEINLNPKGHGPMAMITRWLVNAFGLVLVSRVIDGIEFQGQGTHLFLQVLVASAILGLVNVALRPLIFLLTLPFTILTLGLFTVVINAGMLYLTSLAVPAFIIKGFWPAIWGALLLSLISMFMNMLFAATHIKLPGREEDGPA